MDSLFFVPKCKLLLRGHEPDEAGQPFIGEELNFLVGHEDERLQLAIGHQQHEGAGPSFALAVLIQIDRINASTRDYRTDSVEVVHLFMEMELAVEVLPVLGQHDTAIVFCGDDSGDHVAIDHLTIGTNT